MRLILALIGCFTVLLLIVGCGGSDNDDSEATSLQISPQSASIRPGQTVSFTAFASGLGSRVTWSATGGTITAGGVYTAPSTAGTYTITARPEAASTPTATATVTVTVPSVTINLPATSNVIIARSTVQASATLAGLSGGVEWSLEGNPSGSIAGDGTFRPTAAGTFTIVARSQADPTVVARRTVTVSSAVNVRFRFQNRGDVVLSLNLAEAPNTSANLVTLVNRGFYDGIWVHRAEPDSSNVPVVQWGDPNTIGRDPSESSFTPGSGGPGYTIAFESNSLTHVRYALGMARTSAGLDTAGSQIYICRQDIPSLDGDYVIFGSVVAGQSVVDALVRGDLIESARTEAP